MFKLIIINLLIILSLTVCSIHFDTQKILTEISKKR